MRIECNMSLTKYICDLLGLLLLFSQTMHKEKDLCNVDLFLVLFSVLSFFT